MNINMKIDQSIPPLTMILVAKVLIIYVMSW